MICFHIFYAIFASAAYNLTKYRKISVTFEVIMRRPWPWSLNFSRLFSLSLHVLLKQNCNAAENIVKIYFVGLFNGSYIVRPLSFARDFPQIHVYFDTVCRWWAVLKCCWGNITGLDYLSKLLHVSSKWYWSVNRNKLILTYYGMLLLTSSVAVHIYFLLFLFINILLWEFLCINKVAIIYWLQW